MYACMYVCMYVCMCVCLFVFNVMYVFMYVCMYVCMYACMHVCMYVSMYVWSFSSWQAQVSELELSRQTDKSSDNPSHKLTNATDEKKKCAPSQRYKKIEYKM